MPTDLPNERTLREPGTLELDPTGEGMAIDETPRLIASNMVEGTAVYDRSGRHLGAIHNFMVDKVSGQVAYAVLAFGGCLGLGGLRGLPRARRDPPPAAVEEPQLQHGTRRLRGRHRARRARGGAEPGGRL